MSKVCGAAALTNGSQNGKKPMIPPVATAGGKIWSVAVYLFGAAAFGKFAKLANC